ncbi:MAG TPA: hypothetical protein VJ790_18110 [Dongiaceae bacterium]|nr:hypothetical protein [Dongiaceae bacterium]
MKSVATKGAKQHDLHARYCEPLVSQHGLLGEVRIVSRHVTISSASSREIANARKT